MRKQWNRFRQWIREIRPVTTREADRRLQFIRDDLRHVEDKHSSSERELRKRHAAELEKRSESVKSLLEKVAKTQWRHDRGLGYQLNIRLNPDVLGGVSPYRDDMNFLAEMIGRQVEGEISSGHYVLAAREQYIRDRTYRTY